MKFGNPICFSKGVSFVPLLSFPSSPYGAVPELRGEKGKKRNVGQKNSIMSQYSFSIFVFFFSCGTETSLLYFA